MKSKLESVLICLRSEPSVYNLVDGVPVVL